MVEELKDIKASCVHEWNEREKKREEADEKIKSLNAQINSIRNPEFHILRGCNYEITIEDAIEEESIRSEFFSESEMDESRVVEPKNRECDSPSCAVETLPTTQKIHWKGQDKL
uniref:Ovule protein n=1 Tax=Parastrongyloides trichosuri TaxID=131310 RepID=A0A0N4Z436_PARTI